MATKLHTRRALTLDDYFLLLSLACLTGAAILVLKFTRIIFIVEALELDQPLNTQFSNEDLSAALDAISVIDASWCLMWTSTFFVKFSFLALFRLEDHHYLLLGCRGAHGAHVAVHGQQTIHLLPKVWSRSE